MLSDGGNLDDEPEAQHPGEPLEHLEGWSMLTRLKPRNVRLTHSELPGELRLRQPVLGAVTRNGHRDGPGES